MPGRFTAKLILVISILVLQSCFDQLSEQQLASKPESSEVPFAPQPVDNESTNSNNIVKPCPDGMSPLLDPMSVGPDNPLCGSKPSIEKLSIPSIAFADRDLTMQLAVSGTIQSVKLNPGQIDLTGKASYSLRPTASTSYTLYVSNAYGTVSKTVHVDVQSKINPTPIANDSCSSLDDVITYSATRLITDFGVVPNSDQDQTAKLQLALDSLKSGDRLLFLPGIYLHNKRLNITKANVVIEGNSSDLRGTNADDQAIMIQANNVVVRNFIITNFTTGRKSAPWNSGISAYGINSGQKLYDIKIMNNILVPVDGLGLNYQNGAGIFIYNTENYLVSGNLVARSYADGIHSTARSKNGRVLYNIVLQTGDDGIAIVSYLDKEWRSKTNVDVNFLKNNYENGIVSNVLIHKNIVSGAYWGRGITVVGGKNISIMNNTISKIFGAAGLYISRESAYETAGVNNVLAKSNVITDIATTVPEFIPQGPNYTSLNATIAIGPVTGQGGVEIYSSFSNADYAYPNAPDALSVQNIQIEKSTVTNTKWEAIRVGLFSNHLQGLNFIENSIANQGQGKQPIYFKTDIFDKTPHCSSNKANSADFTSTFCLASVAKYPVSGFMCYLP